jgi:hypothetical protein
MISSRQFHIFHDGNNLSNDQLSLIYDAVDKRGRILDAALRNLQQTAERMEPPATPQPKPVRQKSVRKTPVKKTNTIVQVVPEQEVLKGKVSYKVKGPDGRLMNLAEVKNWVNSIYDGNQGIIKQ